MRDSAWGMDWRDLRNLGKNNVPDFMEGFDPSDMTKKQHDHMLAQVYDGYKTKPVDNYEMRGAGSGRTNVKVGTNDVFNPAAYKDNEAWRKVAEAANISNINNKTDVAQMYQFIEDAKDKERLDRRLAELESSFEPKPEPTLVDNRPVELSEELNSARNNVDDFNNNLDNTGNFLFSRSKNAAQAFKDDYTTNITKAYMEEDPTTLATNKAKMYEKSAQKANLSNNSAVPSLSFTPSTYR